MKRCLLHWAIRYVENNPEDSIRFKVLLINLMTYFARQTTNDLDDKLVDQLAMRIIPARRRGLASISEGGVERTIG